MSYNEVLQVLISVCPTVSAVLTLLIGFISLVKVIKSIKTENDDNKTMYLEELKTFRNTINKLNSKLNSIEQTLIEEQNKEGK